jgi:hypothetical protein
MCEDLLVKPYFNVLNTVIFHAKMRQAPKIRDVPRWVQVSIRNHPARLQIVIFTLRPVE